MTKTEAAFVSSTRMATELAIVTRMAKTMSISVKNAKAIAHRAGSKARGFAPITDFIDEMSVSTIKLINTINQQSLSLSRLAIRESQLSDTLTKFNQVITSSQQARFISTLSDSTAKLKQQHKSVITKLCKQALHLKNLMNEISQNMMIATFIVSSSRIESVNAEEYQSSLELIADNIESACITIRDRVQTSSQRLENASYQWKMQEHHYQR